MKKKILVSILTLLMVFSLVGCGNNNRYPRIVLYQDTWEVNNLEISIGSNYKYKDYEKVTNDDGSCSLIINFEKSE